MANEKALIDIGKRLHAVRGEVDQRGFSRLVNVSQQAISNYERGNLPGSWSFLRRLNEELNVNLNWLFSGQGLKDYRAGTPYASLADNRPPEWPQAFLGQVAFQETHLLERLLGLYFLYLFTEPADAKTRLMADFQAIVDLARRELGAPERGESEKLLVAVLDALATDDRSRAVESLIALGENMEHGGEDSSPSSARRAYLAALNLARMQGLRDQEVDAAGSAGRTYGKEGRWSEAERLFDEVVSRFADPDPRGTPPVNGDQNAVVSPAAAARALAQYGDIARHKGELSTARERYRTALRWANREDDAALQTRIRRDLALLEALVQRESGDVDGAAAGLRALAQEAEGKKDSALMAAVSVRLAQVLVDRGSYDEAEGVLRTTAAVAEAQGDAAELARRRILAARIASARGQNKAARSGFLDTLRYARNHGLVREFDQAAAAFDKALEIMDASSSKAH